MGTLGQKLDYLTDTKSILKQKINNLGGSLTDESTFRSYGNYLDELYNEMPKVTGEGTEITLTPTRKGRIQLGLKGNTSQDSTTGKNKLPYPYAETTVTRKGITFTDNGDGSITINGTAQGNSSFTLFGSANPEMQENFPGNYILGKNCSNLILCRAMYADKQESGTVFYRIAGQSTGTSVQINATQYPKGYAEITVLNGTTVDNVTIYPMITDTQDNDYEPYTGGQPSPNPDYSQPIHVVTGENTIEVQGKNLFDNSVERKNAYPGGSIGEKIAYVNSIATYSYVKCAYLEAGKTYTISWQQNISPSSTNDRVSRIIDENNINLASFTSWRSNSNSISYTPSVSGYLVLSTDINSTNIMIEEGSTATDYEPYVEPQNYPINLGSLELCKIGDYQDYIYKENGNWYKRIAVKKVALGNINWTLYDNRVFYTNSPSISFSEKYLPYCKYFVPASSDETEIVNKIYYNVSNNHLNIRPSDDFIAQYNTAQLLKQWLLYNNVIAYIPRTPTTTQITDETLIAQLDAIENAMSTTGTATITQTNSNLPFIITASALKTFTE